MELEPMSNPNMYFIYFIYLISLIRYKFNKKNLHLSLLFKKNVVLLSHI